MQEAATAMHQTSMLDNAGEEKRQIVITKKEVVLPTDEEVLSTTSIQLSKKEEEFATISSANEDAYYEVSSTKINEQVVREVPIFVEDRNYMIPSHISEDMQTTEVSNFRKKYLCYYG